jgi:hypothetical protein
VGGGSAVGEDDDERNVTIKWMGNLCRSESQVKKQVGWWLFRSIEYGGWRNGRERVMRNWWHESMFWFNDWGIVEEIEDLGEQWRGFVLM